MKVAVIGGRTFLDKNFVFESLDTFSKTECIDTIISGGAAGVDSFAKEYARKHHLPLVEFKPDYEKFSPKIAPLIRNKLIVSEAEIVLAFPSTGSRGTYRAIAEAEKLGKRVVIFKKVI
jgi:predicted Rossmann fold nucleotide-binding protein DprA/Smf involved in DNA uptake